MIVKTIKILILLFPVVILGQNHKKFKKRVLENTEISLLTSYYTQDGKHASVTGGIGSELLIDFATDVNISIPVNADDVLTINGTISAYSSASSSNLNPFTTGASQKTGASRGGDGDNYKNEYDKSVVNNQASTSVYGSPWTIATGASKKDVWTNGNLSYSHSSDDRNTTVSGGLGIANEFDYFSFGLNAGLVKLFNKKNTEISLHTKVYLDQWYPEYPSEIRTYVKNNGNLNASNFSGVNILDHNGNVINKSGPNAWKPLHNNFISDKKRNSYTVSLSFSQILNENSQFSIFADITYQAGWLGNPTQRVYFADRPNFYIGDPANIPNYTNPSNKKVFQLADDYEHLPSSRFKIPVGLRFHYYINDFLVLRTYYRYYFDDWNIKSHTFKVELPVKLNYYFTLYPNYRFYNQTAAKYFAPYEQHLSTEQYYTSDYDLSAYNAQQYGFGIKYSDATLSEHLWKLGLKTVSLSGNYYIRSDGLTAKIASLGVIFILDK